MIKQSQLDLISEVPSLKVLPSAKLKSEDRRGIHAWTNFYAAFSERFVISALESLGGNSKQKLLDPFVGSGTTLVAALKMGLPAIGIDLDPFSCILARAKIAINFDEKDVRAILKSTRRKISTRKFSPQANILFDQNSLVYASAVFDRIFDRINSPNVLDTILSDKKGIYDSEAVALAALCIAASNSAMLIQGSNPTWYRQASEGEKQENVDLMISVVTVTEMMLDDLSKLSASSGKRNILILNRDIKDLKTEIAKSAINFVITSPPYLTRLDYIVKHLPNLVILSGLLDINVEGLRKAMIGTPKIVSKGEFKSVWGLECLKTLKKINTHPSYASNNYYVWMYYQYFDSLYKTIAILKERMTFDCRGLFVVQNSFYKDVEIDLHKILIEMMSGFGISASSIRNDEVKSNMRRLNPARQMPHMEKKSNEHTVYFENKF